MFEIKITFRELDREGRHVYKTVNCEGKSYATNKYEDILHELRISNFVDVCVNDGLRFSFASDTVYSVTLTELEIE